MTVQQITHHWHPGGWAWPSNPALWPHHSERALHALQKDEDKKRKEDKSKNDTRDKGRSRDDKGRSSKEDLPSRHTWSGREKDSASKRKDSSSKKSDGKAADDNHRRKPSDKAKAEDDKEGHKGVASPKEAISKKRTTSEGHEPDAKQVCSIPGNHVIVTATCISCGCPYALAPALIILRVVLHDSQNHIP